MGACRANATIEQVLGFHSCSTTHPRNLDKAPQTSGDLVIRIPLLTLTNLLFHADAGFWPGEVLHPSCPTAFLATFR